MQQEIQTKKQLKKQKKIKIYLGILILIFALLSMVLFYKIIFTKKTLFISPLSSIGFSKNTSFENKLKNAKIDFTRLNISKNEYRFDVKGEGLVIMTGTKNIDEQISSLQVILKNLKIKGIRFKSLDFRYDKPVIIQYD